MLGILGPGGAWVHCGDLFKNGAAGALKWILGRRKFGDDLSKVPIIDCSSPKIISHLYYWSNVAVNGQMPFEGLG